MKGEYYDKVEIISIDDAWNLIFEYYHEDIESHIYSRQEIFSESEEDSRKYVYDSWYLDGISSVEGFYLRDDGMVEVEV